MSARPAPAPSTLQAALDAVLTASDDRAAETLLALQADLLNASGSRLVAIGLDAAPLALALRAAAEGRIIQETHAAGARVAAPLGYHADVALVAVHELERATPLTLALAQERLELSTALWRARSRRGDDDWPAAAALTRSLGVAPSRGSAWHAAAAALSAVSGARWALIATLRDGAVVSVADSRDPTPGPEHVATLRLMAGEAYDSGSIGPGTRASPALRAAAEGAPVAAARATMGGREVVVVTIGATRPQVVEPAALLLAAARLPERSLAPPRLVAHLADRLPWPAGWTPEKRQRWSARTILGSPLLLLLLPIPVGVNAPVAVEALDRRVIAAPFDSRIEAVLAEPGDHVQANRPLLRLDARALESELADASANLQAALSQADMARIDGRSDDERLARLRAQQFAARVQALRLRVASAELRAPIDGIVGGDDLRKRVGAPVSRGEPLFTVARPGRYRAEVRVPDRAIGEVRVGDRLTLALKAYPLGRPDATVTRIYPIAETERGDNVFRVIAELDAGDATRLLPGMEGQASIRTGWAPLGWALLKAPVRWVRQQLWV